MMFKTNLAWFDQPTSITIDQDLAEKLHLIKPQKNSIDGSLEITFTNVKKGRGNIISVSYIILNTQKIHERHLQLNTEELTSWESVALGIAYIYNKKPNKPEGRGYLHRSISHDIYSCLPFYILKKEDLCKSDDIGSTYIKDALHMDDVFPDFFITLARKEKNMLRQDYITEFAYKKFPKDRNILDLYSSHLFSKKDYKRCIEVINEILDITKQNNSFETRHIFERLFNCFILTKDYSEVEKLLQNVHLIPEEERLFFTGLYYYFHNIDQTKAAKYFKQAIIAEMHDGELSFACIVFLMGSYLAMNKHEKLNDAIQLLPLNFQIRDSFYVMPYFSIELVKPIVTILEQCLPFAKNTNKSTVSGFLGMFYEYQISNNQISNTKKATSIKNAGIKLLKKALKDHNKSLPFNISFTNLLYHAKKYDDAMIAQFGCYENDGESSWNNSQVKLSDCSLSFIQRYPSILSEQLNSVSDIENYLYSTFPDDIDFLAQKKMYDAIVEIYITFESYITNIKIKNLHLFKFMSNDLNFLFNIALALHEKKQIDDALKMYLMYIKYEKSASAFNNIAILYEEKNDKNNAQKFIKKAVELSHSIDKIINKNHERIVKNERIDASNDTHKTPQINKNSHEQHSFQPFRFDAEISYLKISRYEIPIGKNTRLFVCLDALFRVDDIYGEICFSEIADIIDIDNPPNDKNVYNWIDQIRKKITLSTGINDLFITTKRSLKINENYLQKS